MTARRRPLTRDNLDVEQTLKRAVKVAPEIELGWSLIRQAMRDAGWPTRTPDDDRRSSRRPKSRCALCGEDFATQDAVRTHRDETGHGEFTTEAGEPPSGIDYADPTGDMALRLDALADDFEAMQDHWHLVATSLHALAMIARKHIPATGAVKTEPACWVLSCDQPVEKTPSGNGYRGMEQIAGLWVAKPGVRPMCVRHWRSADNS